MDRIFVCLKQRKEGNGLRNERFSQLQEGGKKWLPDGTEKFTGRGVLRGQTVYRGSGLSVSVHESVVL